MALHFRTATTVFAKTLPFVLLRAGVGLALGTITVLYFGLAGWLGFTLFDRGTISGPIAVIGLVAATGLFVWGWRLVSRYVLYLVTAGHVAVIAHVVETGEAPPNQLRYGREKVTERFAQVSALFAVDRIVKGAVKQFNDGVVSVAGFASVAPGLGKLIRLVGKAVAVAAAYIDEAIIAYAFTTDSGDLSAWESARDGVVLYGKNWRPILGSTVAIVIGLYATGFLVLLALTPLAAALGTLSGSLEAIGWIVVVGAFLALYAGVLKPWVKTVVITTFLVEARDSTPDTETAERIADRSPKFEELVTKAGEEGSRAATGAPLGSRIRSRY